jgi:hypothetical protein
VGLGAGGRRYGTRRVPTTLDALVCPRAAQPRRPLVLVRGRVGECGRRDHVVLRLMIEDVATCYRRFRRVAWGVRRPPIAVPCIRPAMSGNLLTVASLPTPAEAEVVRLRLDAAGIRSYLSGSSTSAISLCLARSSSPFATGRTHFGRGWMFG